MDLTHKDYEETVSKAKIVPDVKDAIITFVGKGKKSYEEIVKHIQESNNMTNDKIIAQINDVKKTSDFTKVIAEVEEE